MKPGTALTPFEMAVLKAALEIPFGETRSYAWVAQRIGRPGAVRAVGQALRKNPWPLIIPCHRVIKADGSPGKYAGKDDGRKKQLIDLERSLQESFSGRDFPLDVNGVGAGLSRQEIVDAVRESRARSL